MASDQVEQLIGEVESITGCDPNFARMYVRDGWRRTMAMRTWSCTWRRSHIVIPAAITSTATSTASVVQDSDEVTFSTLPVDGSLVGLQFRSGNGPIHDIVGVISSTKVRVRPDYSGATDAAAAFTIMRRYVTLPSDCQEIIAVTHPTLNRRLTHNYQREMLDARDANRTKSGTGDPRLLCPLDWSLSQVGSVDPVVRVVGSGPKPISSGEFSGADRAMFTVTVTTGGLGAAVVFSWRRNEETLVTGVVADTSSGNALSDEVSVLWDVDVTYVLGDTFIIVADAGVRTGAPRHEIYPCPTSRTVLPLLYSASQPDITDDGAVVPSFFADRLDVIKEKALEFAASAPNSTYSQVPFSGISRREYHAANWLIQVRLLERVDEQLCGRNVQLVLPTVPLPWGSGSDANFTDDPYQPRWL
jgi:hypothetical protein